MAGNDVTPAHLSWIVAGRSANQETTMKLYNLIYNNDETLSKFNPELHAAAQELVGIAFSLWRAVFLSDTTAEFNDQRADMSKFLISLISDNAVMYATDKNSRNWSFRYYLDNALSRLEKLSLGRLRLVEPTEGGKSAESDKDEWTDAQAAFGRAVEQFGEALKAT